MKRLIASIRYALQGVGEGVSTEPNMQIHIVVAIIVVVAGFFFSIHTWEWVAIILCMMIVFGLELLNTAIETLLDHVSPEKHDAVRKAKDISAGAVLVGAIGSVLVGLIIFLPKLLTLVSSN